MWKAKVRSKVQVEEALDFTFALPLDTFALLLDVCPLISA